MRRLGLALVFLSLGLAPAQPQPVSNPANGIAGAYNSVAPTCTNGVFCWLQVDINGQLKVVGTFTPSGSSPEFTPVAPAAATATKGVLLGTQYNSTQATLTDGQQGSVQASVRGAIMVAVGADGFAVTSATQAPVAPATATATKSDLVGCQATSVAINPTTGQQAAVDCDLNNNLLVSSGGAPNLSISQVSVATSDTAVVSARALRRSVTIQQITGTQNVFCNQTTATAGNGVVLPAVVGASFTFNTTSAIRCIAITGAQTVAVAETF